jgi:replication factor C small subunit
MEIAVWAEKYRPRKLSEVINQKHVVERAKAFVEEKNIPHMLFAGPPGSGKTTVALCIAYELYGDSWRQNVLELNASDARGIDVIRGQVKDFARTKPIGEVPYKIIILDEADNLTSDAQQALRRTMEAFTAVSRFCLICNFSSKIIEPIQSRCAVFRFKALTEADIRKYIDRIVKGEKLKITEDGIKAIVEICEGDLRKVANLLQAAASVGKKIDEDTIYEVASRAKPTDIKEMLELVLKGKFDDARKKLQDLLLRQGLSGTDIISEIHKQIYSLNIPEDLKIKLVEKCGEYEFRLNMGGNEVIQLESLLAQFLLATKQ